MKFVIIDTLSTQEDHDSLIEALWAQGPNFGKIVICWIVNKHNHQDFQNLASQLKEEIWSGEVILQRVLVTKIKTDTETEIFQRDLEESQINILLEYYKQRLKDEFVEIVDLRV